IYTQIPLFIYALGVVFFLFRFVRKLLKLHRLMNRASKTYHQNGIRFMETDLRINPFSFFKTMVFNPGSHDKDDRETIIKHEETHIRNWHSLDILLANLFVVFNWFNPLAWIYQKRVSQNLEFLADREATIQARSKKAYQMSLLKAALPDHLKLPV